MAAAPDDQGARPGGESMVCAHLSLLAVQGTSSILSATQPCLNTMYACVLCYLSRAVSFTEQSAAQKLVT